MKTIFAVLAVATLSTACVSETDNSWYATKIRAQDQQNDTLNAPVPGRDADAYYGRGSKHY
ncbi:hypothetical protein [Mesorhizobium sp. CAU 1741]|uniref:hypothetical protein n=1 Tax=Mesorhizobium sp. CAU 1741 TaxID=3140366 RepID=UPI00325B6891